MSILLAHKNLLDKNSLITRNMMNFSFIKLVTLLFLFLFCFDGTAQEDALKYKIDEESIGINISDSNSFERLTSDFIGFTTVGLGESTHHSSYIDSVRCEIIKSGINEGFDAICFEADHRIALRLNDYVNLKTDTLVQDSIYGFPYTRHVKQLIEWCRNHNIKNPNSKIWILGLEIRGVENAVKELIRITANLRETNRLVINDLKFETVEQFQSIISTLENLQIDTADLYKKHLYKMTLQTLNLRKSEKARRVNRNFRDQTMFTNYMALKNDYKFHKAFILAHSGHVSKERIWRHISPLGQRLSKRLGAEYASVTINFGNGIIGTYIKDGNNLKYGRKHYNISADKGSYEHYLNLSNKDFFYLNTKSKDKLLDRFFDKKRKLSIIQTTYPSKYFFKVSLKSTFDYIIFIKHI